MAESAVSFLIEYVGPLLVDEVKLLKGVRGEARKIRDELESMQAFLRDADAREDSDESIKTWVGQVRHAAHETEDILDEFILHIGQYQLDGRGVFGVLRRMAHSIKQLKVRHRIGRQIQEMRSRLSDISKRKDDYDLNRTEQVSIQTSTNDGVYDPRIAALFTEESALVGIDEPRARLVGWLLREEQRLSIMSVVGMGGLGKTTLVKKVYDSEQVKNHFETYAWITVSETFKKMDLLKNMITHFYQAKEEQAPSAIDAMTDIQLIEVLRDYLQKKRFVLVFDDVWEIDAWKLLSLVLPSGEYGSRVILTTRRRDVASSCCIGPSDYIYDPPRLNQNMAWSLFCRRAFPTNERNCCPPELEQLAQSFVKKCCGLPLAIVTLGGLLACKDQTYSVWEVMHRSLGSELESDSLKSMTEILWLSFKDLPYYLKSCYLYFSVFPEDHFFISQVVISLWMAEGFIIRKEGMTPEEVGESYIRALIIRSLVQVTEAERYGNIITFRIHDLLREIIISKSKEENLFVSSSSEENIVFPDRIRRLSIHEKSAIFPMCTSSSHLRSLFIFGTNELSIAASIPSFSGLYFLRVLYIVNVPMERFPEQITSLLHLRYLRLHNNKIRHLPSSIGKLINLEALNLVNTLVYELPVEIHKLQRLRELIVCDYLRVAAFPKPDGAKVASGLGSLRSLQRLSLKQVTSGVVVELGKLTQLRMLAVAELRREDGRDFCTSVEKMSHLQILRVESGEDGEEIDLHSLSRPPPTLRRLVLSGRLKKLPQWIFALQNLLALHLSRSRLKDDPLKALGSLPNLLQLQLINAYDGEESCAKEGEYPKLRELCLRGLRGLKNVRVEKGAMPNLEILSIHHCEALVEEPCWLQHLTNLRNLHLNGVPPDFLNCLRSGAERADFIRHIPLVSYYDTQTRRTQQL